MFTVDQMITLNVKGVAHTDKVIVLNTTEHFSIL